MRAGRLSGRKPLRRPYEAWLGRFRHLSAAYPYRAGEPNANALGDVDELVAELERAIEAADPDTVAAFVGANAGAQGFAQASAVTGTNGQVIFKAKCASCHTLAAAGSTGTIGPNLDQFKPPFARVKKQVIHGGAIMPAFQSVLTDAQITAVAKYVASHAGKK